MSDGSDMATGLIVVPLIAVALALSFLLSGMEAGVFALSRLRIRQQMRSGRRAARLLHGYLDDTENFLWTILVGNTVANFIALSSLIVQLHQVLGRQPAAFALALFLAVFLFYALFDLLPKMLFRQFPNRLCLLLVRPFRFIHLALSPLVGIVQHTSDWLLGWTGGKSFTGHLFGSREELRLVMQESAQGMTSEERQMINRVLDLQTLVVRQIARPISQVVTVTRQTPVREALQLCQEKNLTRLPVWDVPGTGRKLMGVVSLKTLLYGPELKPDEPIGPYVQKPLFLDQDLRLELALQQMQQSGQRLAVVMGRGGVELGILSLQDILTAIFGEVSL